jgi:hypothetical protein
MWSLYTTSGYPSTPGGHSHFVIFCRFIWFLPPYVIIMQVLSSDCCAFFLQKITRRAIMDLSQATTEAFASGQITARRGSSWTKKQAY